MKIGWKYVLHDRLRVLVTVLGIAFAYFLMVFQASLLFGFMRAASSVISAADGQLWVMARGVPCFDLPAPVSSRYADLLHGVSGVAQVVPIVIGFAEFRRPGGEHQLIALVGTEPGVGARFPVPVVSSTGRVPAPEALLLDRASTEWLDVRSIPQPTQVNGVRAVVRGTVTGFSSFIGCPYVFTSSRDARTYLGLKRDEAMYFVVQLHEGTSVSSVKRDLEARLPELDVWTQDEFVRRSQRYWLTQTGAGAGILAAAVLGFLIGLVVASQSIYATTVENIDEYATLKALGASRGFIIRTVVAQAIICATAGCVLGVGATAPLVRLAPNVVTWIHTPWWLPAAIIPPSFIMCGLAAVMSVRTALSVDPARVFRA